MVPFLTELLREVYGWKIPMVFDYYSTRMVLAALTTLCMSIFLGPWFIRKLYEQRIGQPIRKEDCPMLAELHAKKEDTPTMGGILILSSLLVALLLWMDLTDIFTLILGSTLLVLGGLGARDDWLKLRYRSSDGLAGRKKLAVQLLFSALIAVYLLCPTVSEFLHIGDCFQPPFAKEADGTELQTYEYMTRLYVPFLKTPLVGLSAFLLGGLILFVVVGCSNAVNLTDGLDGLAAGCVTMVAATLGAFAFVSNHTGIAEYLHILYIDGAGEIAIFLSALVGACLGFLWYNGHPAQVFMGDTGSLALGGVIGVSAVLLRRELLLGIVGGIFVMEALSVILQVASFKLRKGKRIFLCAPLHHHFEYKGWPETKVVLRFWIIGLLFAMLGLASLKFQ